MTTSSVRRTTENLRNPSASMRDCSQSMNVGSSHPRSEGAMNRKQFLKTLTAAAMGTSVLSVLKGCSPLAPIVYARLDEDRALLPASSLGDLSVAGSYIKVYVASNANPLLLFQRDDRELTAVSSTCSHSGCEVMKLRTKFECPCHGSEYDLHGNVLRGPAPDPLQVFSVVRSGETVEIHLRGLL